MSRAAPALRLDRLWPTKLVRRQLRDFTRPNQDLEALILADDARESDYTVRYQEQDIFKRTDAAVRWLAMQVEETVAGYLHHVGIHELPRWSVEGWYNVNRLGDHHAPHAHPGSYLSGTYYVQVPARPPADVEARPGSNWGCISFHDPRCAANVLAAGGEPDANAVHVERPRAGLLLMWPAMLQHYVHPNRAHEPRISISFNVVLLDQYRTR